MSRERRRQPRHQSPLKAWYRVGRCFHSVKLTDYNDLGASLAMPGTTVRRGDRVELGVECGGRVWVFDAVVVWAQPDHSGATEVGVKFKPFYLRAG